MSSTLDLGSVIYWGQFHRFGVSELGSVILSLVLLFYRLGLLLIVTSNCILRRAELEILYIFEYFLASSDYINEHQSIFERINLLNHAQ